MSKKKPAVSVEKTIAGIAKAIHELREEGNSTDNLVGVVTRGLAAITVRVEEIERRLSEHSSDIADLRRPPRTWAAFFRGE